MCEFCHETTDKKRKTPLSRTEKQRDQLTLALAIEEAGQLPCQNYPDAFFPDKLEHTYGASDIKMAKSLCKECPIVIECGKFAIKWEEEGIWGGFTKAERKKLHRA